VQFPIVIGLRRSLLLSILLVTMHAVTAACIIALPWPLLWRGMVSLALACSLGYALRPPGIIGLRLVAGDRLECLRAASDCVAATVLADSAVFARLIVLRLRVGEEARVISLVLLPDQMPVEQFRALRLWLRWHAEPKDGGAGAAF
jgi:hypothetical protein